MSQSRPSPITRILIIEDDDDDYVLAADYLNDIEFLNIELFHADSAQAGLAMLHERDYDLCLLDYQLGAVNGLEVLQKAKAIGFSAPIIMLTGQSDAILDQAALDMGAADYLIKTELTSNRFARSIRYALARREVEQERVERLKAESENRSKNRFLAHLSHELRTPLTSILGYTELLMQSDKGAAAYCELDIIFRNGKHLLNLLNDVLDLSKIAAGKLELVAEPVYIDSLLADVYMLMRAAAEDKGLKLNLISESPVPVQIQTDSTRLRQVLINVVSNAIKFTDSGHIDVSIFVDAHTQLLHFDVSDTGMGIPPEKIESIFQPFTQVEDVVSKSIGGTGLGLAICSELVQRMGGDIRVTSDMGKGSCFSICIDPGCTDGVPYETLSFYHSVHVESQTIEQDCFDGRVLVVDDLPDIRRLVGHVVSQTGAHVDYAENGAIAIDLIDGADADGQPYHLVLMDIHMPEMDGRRAIVQLRQRYQALPVVALTAASMKGQNEKLLAKGFTDVLSKPLDNKALMQTLSRYVPVKGEGHASSVTSTHAADCASSSTLESHQAITAVLLIEDDHDAANAIAMLLQAKGVEVVLAHTHQQALECLQQRREWSHILLDLHLGDENGLDIAADIRANEDYRHTPISIVSGDDPNPQALQSYAIHTVLQKPLQMSALLQVVAPAA